MENEKNEKNEHLHVCHECDFKCCYLSDWNRHITTRKHLTSVNGNNLEINGTKFVEKNNTNDFYQCDFCKKEYKSLSGLWKHKKKCSVKEETIIGNKLILKIIMENQELKELLEEKNKIILELTNFNQVG